MRKSLFALSLLVGVSACTTQQLTDTQADISTGIAAACKDVNAVATLVPAAPEATYAVAACGTATAVASLVQNSGTLVWLGQIQAQLAAAKAAKTAAPAPAAS